MKQHNMLFFFCHYSSPEQSSYQLCSLSQAEDQQPLQVWSLWGPVSMQGCRTPAVAGRGGARGGATATNQEEEGIEGKSKSRGTNTCWLVWILDYALIIFPKLL